MWGVYSSRIAMQASCCLSRSVVFLLYDVISLDYSSRPYAWLFVFSLTLSLVHWLSKSLIFICWLCWFYAGMMSLFDVFGFWILLIALPLVITELELYAKCFAKSLLSLTLLFLRFIIWINLVNRTLFSLSISLCLWFLTLGLNASRSLEVSYLLALFSKNIGVLVSTAPLMLIKFLARLLRCWAWINS